MKYIKQKHKYGCAVACLAMLTDVSYEGALNYLYPKRKYRSKVAAIKQLETVKTLIELGFNPKVLYPDNLLSIKTKALLVIKGSPGYTHAVVWDPKSKMVLDPAISHFSYIKELNIKDIKKYNDYYKKNLCYALRIK